MSKSIGYYSDTNHPAIAAIEKKYGSNFKGMNFNEKIGFLRIYALRYIDPARINPSPEVMDFITVLHRDYSMDNDTAIALIKALAANL